MLRKEDIQSKYGLSGITLDNQYADQDSLVLLDKALGQLSTVLNIPNKKIGCNLLNINVSNQIQHMGFIIDDKININLSNISQTSKLAHEWFHFADFYSNNLGYQPNKVLDKEPEFNSEKENTIFSELLNVFSEFKENVAEKEEIIKKYLPNIELTVLKDVLNADYSSIQNFKGLNYLKAELEIVDKTFAEKAEVFDQHLTGGVPYYQKHTEMLARSFETYCSEKLGDDNLIAKSNFFSGLYPQKNLKKQYKKDLG